jgi:hypothetical protein
MFSLRRKQSCAHYTLLWTKQQATCAFFNILSFVRRVERFEAISTKEKRMTIRRVLIDEILAEYETLQDILGEGGLLKELRHRNDRTLS